MGQVLQDLGDMAVRAAHRVGHRGSERLRGKQIRTLEVLAGARVADDQIGHDIGGLDQPFGHRRLQRQRDGRHVRPVLVEVPSVVGVPRGAFLEPVVGPQVDDDGVRVELRGKRPGGPVRQCQDDHVMAVEHLRRGVLHHQIGQLRDVGHVSAQPVPHRGMSRHAGHLERGMRRQDAQRLASRISCGPCHGDRVFRHFASPFRA